VATAQSVAYTSVASLNEVSKKTNTDVMTAIKTTTEEYDWFDDMPKEDIVPSGNEMRLVLDIRHATGTAMIPDGGYEAVLGSVAPNSGTFTFVQANQRYSFTTLAKAYDAKGRSGFIKRQILYQASKATEALAETIGLQTYGFSTGTVWVVRTTGSGGTVQTDIAIKNAFGTTLVGGADTAGQAYLAGLLRVGEGVALVRGSTLQDFGVVVASPAASGVAGTVDITFNGSVTPTAGDLIVKANAVTDATITATDTNRWPVGLFDALTSASVHGLATTSESAWAAGYANTAGGRMDYARQEAMVNGLWNNGGVKMNRVIYSQGVRRDIIAGERAALRYNNSSEFDWDGEFGTKGLKYMTSRLVPTGMFFGYNNEVCRKLVLSDKPPQEGGPSIFSLDKVQDRGAFAASFDFVYCRTVNNRAGMGYASGLTEQ
jgi:hypothetical protein